MPKYDSWPKVFALASEIARELRAKNPSMKQSDAVKKAFKDSRYLSAKAEFDAHKAKRK